MSGVPLWRFRPCLLGQTGRGVFPTFLAKGCPAAPILLVFNQVPATARAGWREDVSASAVLNDLSWR